MILDPKIKNLINQRALEVDISLGEAEEIWLSMGNFIKETIKSASPLNLESFKNVYIKGLGTFYAVEKRIINYPKEINEPIKQL